MKVQRKSFSLLELMIAITILSVGIILVIRSFLGSSTALDVSYNRTQAVKFLDNKLADLENKAFLEKGSVKVSSSKEETSIGMRKAVFSSEIYNLDTDSEKKYLNEVNYSLAWKEGNIEKNEIIATYLRNAE
jgi:type II secretory pathway pseudopilin PulG